MRAPSSGGRRRRGRGLLSGLAGLIGLGRRRKRVVRRRGRGILDIFSNPISQVRGLLGVGRRRRRRGRGMPQGVYAGGRRVYRGVYGGRRRMRRGGWSLAGLSNAFNKGKSLYEKARAIHDRVKSGQLVSKVLSAVGANGLAQKAGAYGYGRRRRRMRRGGWSLAGLSNAFNKGKSLYEKARAIHDRVKSGQLVSKVLSAVGANGLAQKAGAYGYGRRRRRMRRGRGFLGDLFSSIPKGIGMVVNPVKNLVADQVIKRVFGGRRRRMRYRRKVYRSGIVPRLGGIVV